MNRRKYVHTKFNLTKQTDEIDHCTSPSPSNDAVCEPLATTVPVD